MRGEKRSGSRARAAAEAPCGSSWSLNHHRVANVGGAMTIWAALTRMIAVAGVIHSDRWISVWSTTTAFPSYGTSMRKNQVAKRLAPPSGGTQNDKGTR